MLPPPCLPGGIGANAISENGYVTGNYACSLGPSRAFAWFAAPPAVAIPILPGYSDMAGDAINPFMEIAGRIQNNGNPQLNHAFLHSNGQTTVLPLLPGADYAEVAAIHQAMPSTMVGYTNNTAVGPLTAVLWSGTDTVTALEVPLGPHSVAVDINEKFQIVGWMGSIATARGFIWTETGVTDIGLPAGCISGRPTGINNNGEVCGRGSVQNPGLGATVRGWLWSKGIYTQFDPLPGYLRCIPQDVNDDGIVVGFCENPIDPGDPDNPAPGFIWKDGVMTSLQEFVPPGLGIVITGGRGINNAGQIAVGAIIPQCCGRGAILHPIAPIPGDFNCDRIVNMPDLIGVIQSWGTDDAFADFDRDGIVSWPDILIVVGNWS